MQKNIKKVASFLIDNLHTVNLMKNNKKLFYESNSTTYILQPVVSIAQLINWKNDTESSPDRLSGAFLLR